MAWSAYRLRARLNLVKGTVENFLSTLFWTAAGLAGALALIGGIGWASWKVSGGDTEIAAVIIVAAITILAAFLF